jgi:hypothetical protein
VAQSESDFIREALERFKDAQDAEIDIRKEALISDKFVDGDQWPEDIKNFRRSKRRPYLTVNKMRPFVMNIVGDIRQNMPAINVRPVDSQADLEGAKVRKEIIRNIEQNSDAQTVYANGLEQALGGGYGFWRIRTRFTDDDIFEQEIVIEEVKNRFTVFFDQNARKNTYEDAKYVFLASYLPLEEFKRKFPGKDTVGIDPVTEGEFYEGWFEKDRVRVAEYMWKEPTKKTIASFVNPDTGQQMVVDIDKVPEGAEIVRQREVETHKVMWVKMSGTQVLEEKREMPTKFLPVIPVIGNDILIEGKKKYRSLIYDAIDSQRMYNYHYTASIERLGLTAKSPYLLTKQQINGLEKYWNEANTSNRPYLLYNPDTQAGAANPPRREAPPTASSGDMTQLITANNDMRETVGMHQANLGQPSNERSGRAIIARQRQGENNVYKFIDNFLKSVIYTGKILLDMIPKVYDTERIIRITGDRLVPINFVDIDPTTLEPILVNDMAEGKYDYIPEAGVHYLTKRQETLASMLDFLQFVPFAAPIIAPRLAEVGDWPNSQEIAQELRQAIQGNQQQQQQQQGGAVTPPQQASV